MFLILDHWYNSCPGLGDSAKSPVNPENPPLYNDAHENQERRVLETWKS